MSQTRDRILDVAETAIRRFGYSAVSFREIGKDVGISSASIHHHFPAKGDLLAALIDRYRDRFMLRLGAPAGRERAEAARLMASLFEETARSQANMCLCGVLGVELETLPEAAREKTGAFFLGLAEWLAQAMDSDRATSPEVIADALQLVAGLEGALLVARATGQVVLINDAATLWLSRTA